MQFPSMGSEERVSLTMSPRLKRIVNEDNIPCQIDKGLYLGSLGAAHMRLTLKALNVTRVLTLNSSPAELYPNDFVYKTILVHDRVDTNIRSRFNECFAFIDEARAGGGGVLVHCKAGISRSVCIVVAYLMFKNRTSLSDAMRHVTSKRPVASPNSGFRKQLLEYERSLRGNTFTRFISRLLSAAWNKAMVTPCKLQSGDKRKRGPEPADHFPCKRTQPENKLSHDVSDHSALIRQLTQALSKEKEAKARAVKVACDERDKLNKERNRREKKEAFKLGCKAGAQSLLWSFEYKKCVSEPVIGRVRSFLESSSCEAFLASLVDKHLGNGFDYCCGGGQGLAEEGVMGPYRLEVDYFDGMVDLPKEGDLNVVKAHDLTTAMPVGKETPRDE